VKFVGNVRFHVVGAEVNQVRRFSAAKPRVVDKCIAALRDLIEDSIENHVDLEIIVIRGTRVETNGGSPQYIS